MAFEFANILIIMFMTYYSMYIFSLFRKKKRESVKTVNLELDKMREKAVKTLEEQKAFLDMKYPRTEYKFKWRDIPMTLVHIAIFVAIFKGYFMLFEYFDWHASAWFAISFVVFMPLVFNYFLAKFNMERTDLWSIMRFGGRK